MNPDQNIAQCKDNQFFHDMPANATEESIMGYAQYHDGDVETAVLLEINADQSIEGDDLENSMDKVIVLLVYVLVSSSNYKMSWNVYTHPRWTRASFCFHR